jgi:hypothetical protein
LAEICHGVCRGSLNEGNLLRNSLWTKLMSARSQDLRTRKVARFFEIMGPATTDLVLDVGLAGEGPGEFWQYTVNPLSLYAPRQLRILGLSFEDTARIPPSTDYLYVIQADGRQMPFKTGSIDYVFSNAVIEHVGSRRDQRRFVAECLRVAAKGVFLTTPNRRFLLDPHVGIPLIHYLPRPLFTWAVRRLGHPELADIGFLNALSASELAACFPSDTNARVEGVGFDLLPETLVAWAPGPIGERRNGPR